MDVGKRIPHIYAVVDNKYANYQASIIEMEGGTMGRVPGTYSMHFAANKNMLQNQAILR